MNFAEVNVFGVYVAPISLMMIGAWLMLVLVRRVANHYGVLRQVWHPTLFWFAVYMILLAAIVLFVGH